MSEQDAVKLRKEAQQYVNETVFQLSPKGESYGWEQFLGVDLDNESLEEPKGLMKSDNGRIESRNLIDIVQTFRNIRKS